MEIDTKYAAKLFFPNSAFTQIYFEAIANAFDAEADNVDIHISTDGDIKPKHLEITIADNGVGFTDERFEQFRRLKEPSDPYHKGLGRLVYLHYFSSIYVESWFKEKKRVFNFSKQFDGNSKLTDVSRTDKSGSQLKFTGFLRERLRSYNDLKPGSLKHGILEHFLPLFHQKKKQGENFQIKITLETKSANPQREFFSDSQKITVADIPDFECKSFQDNRIHAFCDISMFYMLRQGLGEKSQLTAASVDGRTIPIKLLSPNAIPPSHSAIFIFESEIFSGRSDTSRQRLVIPEDISETLLYRRLRQEMSSVLNEKFPEIEQKNTQTKKKFEKKYPHLIGLFEEDTVGLIDKEEALEIAQRKFFRKQKEVLESGAIDENSFQKSLEVSSRALTEYILYREIIIERLKRIDEENSEADIHNLIVPRYRQFYKDDLIEDIYSNNAWLLDDKFMSFRTILSEAKMKKLIKEITLQEDIDVDDGRPDISMIFSADPDQKEKVDVVVVELKRRRVDDKDTPYASTQLLKRARKLVDYCSNIQRVWYFGIVEVDKDLSQLLEDSGWTPLFSKGQVFYNDFRIRRDDGVQVPVPVCLLSYDAVIQDAATRNHTFLEILRDSFRRASKQ